MDDGQLDAAAEAARSAIDELAVADLGACDRVALGGVLARWRTVRSFTDAFEVRIARRSRQLADEGRSERPEGVLRQGGLRSTRDAHAAAEREQQRDKAWWTVRGEAVEQQRAGAALAQHVGARGPMFGG